MHSNTNQIPSTQNEFYINAQAKQNTVYTSLAHRFMIVPLHNHDIVFSFMAIANNNYYKRKRERDLEQLMGEKCVKNSFTSLWHLIVKENREIR